LTGLGAELLASGRGFVQNVGATTRFLLHLVALTPAGLLRFRLIVEQIYNAGALSLVIIMTSGLFVGMVLGLQGYDLLQRFGSEDSLGTGAALAMPYADSEAMQLHLVEISSRVRRGAHAVLLLDRAGWHTTGRLVVPKNITLVFLPSRAPELNPVENIWQYLRQNWLSNRVFKTYEAIIEAACDAWRSLLAEPTTITSIGHRGWAHVGQK